MANVIDSLLITLGLDPTKLFEGLHSTEEKLKALGEKSKHVAKEMQEEGEHAAKFFDVIKEHAIEFFGVMASVGAFMAFTEHTVQAQVATGRLAKEAHIAVDDLGGLQIAADKMGGSVQGANSSIRMLGENLAVIGTGMPRAKMAATSLGIAMGYTGDQAKTMGEKLFKGKTVMESLLMISEKVGGKDFDMLKAQKTLGRAGVHDEGLLRALGKGKEAFQEYIAEQKKYAATQQDIENSTKFEEMQKDLKFAMEKVAMTIMQYVMPAIKLLGDGLLKISDWAVTHPAQVKAALIAVGVGFLFMSASALAASGSMIKAWMVANMGAVSAAAHFLRTAVSAKAMWTAITGPVGLVVLAIAAVIIMLVAAYNKFEWFHNAVDTVFASIKSYVMTVVGAFVDMFKDAFNLIMGALEFVAGFFTLNSDRMSDGWQKMCHAFADFFKLAGALILFQVLTLAVGIKTAFAAAWDAAKKPAVDFLNWIEDKIDRVGHALRSLIPGTSTYNGNTNYAGGKMDTTTMVTPAPAPAPAPGVFLGDTSFHAPAKVATALSGRGSVAGLTPLVPQVSAGLPKEASRPIQGVPVVIPAGLPATGPVSPPASGPKIGKSIYSEADFAAASERHHIMRMSAGDSVRPATVAGANRTSTNSSVMNVNEINVNAPAATDAQGVAGGITGALQEKHSSMVNQADGGM